MATEMIIFVVVNSGLEEVVEENEEANSDISIAVDKQGSVDNGLNLLTDDTFCLNWVRCRFANFMPIHHSSLST